MTTSATSGAVLLLTNLLLLFGPGLLVTVAAGLPRWTALAAAPLLSYGLVAVTGPLVGALGGRWGPGWLWLAAALAAAIALGLRFGRRTVGGPVPDEADGSGDGGDRPAGAGALRRRFGDLFVLAGIAVGAVVGAGTALQAMGSLDRVNQHWDAIFHANAVRFILDTGNADPSALRALNDYERDSFFYPNSYHAMAAAVGNLTDATVPALLNSQFLLLAGLTGLSLAVLVLRFGGGVALAATVPVLVPAFSAFPNDLLDWGPILSFATALALMPAFIVVVADQLRDRRPAGYLVFALGAVGLLGVHPSVAVTAAVLLVLLLAFRWNRRSALIKPDLIVLAIGGAAALLLGYRYVLGTLSAGVYAAVDWPVVGRPGAMLGILLTLNEGKDYPQFALVVLMVLGLTALHRLRDLRWLLAGGVLFAALFVLAASYEGRWVAVLTGPWWNDRWRLGAIVALPMMVLAGHGLVRLATWTAAAIGSVIRTEQGRTAGLGAALVALLVAFALITDGFYRDDNAERMAVAYEPTRSVSTAEAAGLRVLADLVPAGGRVMNDPYDGSALMYALYDVQPMFGHVIEPETVPDLGPDQRLLLTRFHCLDTDAAVRDLVERYDIGYVFLGDDFVQSRLRRADGLTRLSQVSALEVVYDEDDVRIYRVDPAPPTDADPPAVAGCQT